MDYAPVSKTILGANCIGKKINRMAVVSVVATIRNMRLYVELPLNKLEPQLEVKAARSPITRRVSGRLTTSRTIRPVTNTGREPATDTISVTTNTTSQRNTLSKVVITLS